MAEPIYNKVCDFAMEFCADEEGRVAFAGYSFFETDAFGNYKANLLVSDAEIERRLGAYVSLGTLHGVRSRLLTVLPDWLGGHYAGYLGVDMMICHEGDYRIHPCVEINLRMNMGVLARLFFDRFRKAVSASSIMPVAGKPCVSMKACVRHIRFRLKKANWQAVIFRLLPYIRTRIIRRMCVSGCNALLLC